MLFVASRVLEVIFTPSSFLVLSLVFGTTATLLGFRRTGQSLMGIAVVGLAALGFTPIGRSLARPLEDRFSMPPASLHPAGIIVLGGAIEPAISEARHSIALSMGAGRMTTAALLALRYPEARLVFSGGPPDFFAPDANEAAAAKQLLVSLGVRKDRIILEDRSRNTFENAIFTRRLVQKRPGEIWFLVTSALHMPRAVGSFRKAGFDAIPYPADYRTTGRPVDYWSLQENVSSGLQLVDVATHEWIGLLAYWFLGRTDALVPKQEQL